MTYVLVNDSHCRTFLKEEGYGFIAEIWRDLSMLQVRAVNKGVDMPKEELREIAEKAMKEKHV